MGFVEVRPPGDGRATCRYGASRLSFRGPERPVDGRYLVCLGGAVTLGDGVERPWPSILETTLGLPCLNLGLAQASPDAFLADPEILALLSGAEAVVIEATGAQNMSNRLYAVHPRRNDRFTAAREPLQALFPEVDFADFCFTRHLLGTLAQISPERFEVIRAELQQAWLGRMRRLIEAAEGRVHIAWLAPEPPPSQPPEPGTLGPDPLFVTAAMVTALGRHAAGAYIAPPAPGHLTGTEADADPARHEEIGMALAEELGPQLAQRAAESA